MPFIFSVPAALLLLRKRGIEARPQSGNRYLVHIAGKNFLIRGTDLKKLAERVKKFPHLTTCDIHNYLQERDLQ